MSKRTNLETPIAKWLPMIIALTEVEPKNARFGIEERELNIKGYQLYAELEGTGRGTCLYIQFTQH